MNNDVTIFQPGTLSKHEILMCLSVIEEGDAVDLESATTELPRAVVAVNHDGNDMVAVGAIKRPRPKYASGISLKSGFSFDKNIHELGYVAAKESHRGRGVSHEITAKLLSEFKSRPLFATTSHDGMKRNLQKAGFVQRGKEWTGTKGNLLSLWIKT